MDAKEQQKFALRRITGVLWFFVCLFGVLAAIGVVFKRAKYPDWEVYLQLGFVGGAAALVILGSLQLSQAFMLEDEPIRQRLLRGTGFFLGVSGAMVTLGVFFAILKYPNVDLFLRNGLLGGAATLAVTGFLMLGDVFAMEKPGEDPGSEYQPIGDR